MYTNVSRLYYNGTYIAMSNITTKTIKNPPSNTNISFLISIFFGKRIFE